MSKAIRMYVVVYHIVLAIRNIIKWSIGEKSYIILLFYIATHNLTTYLFDSAYRVFHNICFASWMYILVYLGQIWIQTTISLYHKKHWEVKWRNKKYMKYLHFNNFIMTSFLTSPYFSMDLTKEHHTDVVTL